MIVVVDDTRAPRVTWRFAAPLVGATLMLLLAAYRETVTPLVHMWWTDDSYGHGLLVVPISLYLIWTQRARLAALEPAPKLPLIALVAVTGVLWLGSAITDVLVVEQLSLLLTLGAVVWLILGPEVGRRLVFPLGFVLLAIPIWSVFTPFLRDHTAIMAAKLVQSAGIPLYLEGRHIYIPEGRFEIADVCAGLRFLLAAATVATLYSYLTFTNLYRGAIVVIVAVGWAIAFNWVRVMTIIAVGHFGGMEHPLVTDHNSIGWVLFAIAMVPMFFFGEWMARRSPSSGLSDLEPQANGPRRPANHGRFIAAACLALAVGGSGPLLLSWTERVGTDEAAAAPTPPTGQGGWLGPEPAPNTLGLEFIGADWDWNLSYSRSGAPVEVYVAYYASQQQGRELVNDLNLLYDTQRWREVPLTGKSGLVDSTGLPFRRLNLAAVGSEDSTLCIEYVFLIGGKATSNQYVAKLLQAWSEIRGRTDAYVLALSSEGGGSLDGSESELSLFTRGMLPALIGSVEVSSH